MNIFEEIELIEDTKTDFSSLSEFFFKINSLKQPNLNTDQYLENLEQCYRLRHDALHFSICNWLSLDFYPETSRSINDVFKDVKLKKIQHPDIAEKLSNNVALIGDVSCSRDVNQTRSQKIEKYSNAVSWIKESGYLVYFITLIVEPSLANLENELLSISTILKPYKEVNPDDFNIATLHSFFIEVDETIHFLKNEINNMDLISRYLEEKYSSEDIFQHHEIYTDFPDVDPIFLKGDVKLRSDEEELDLYRQLLDDDDVVSYIQEIPTTPDQFIQAYDDIVSKNSLYQLTDPKPSIYTPLFPLKMQIESIHEYRTDIVVSDWQPEQQSIFNLMATINSLNLNEDVPAFKFVMDFSANFVKMFKGENGKINARLFNKGFYVSQELDLRYRNDYHAYRKHLKDSNMQIPSFSDYLRHDVGLNLPSDKDSRPMKQKIIRVPMENLENKSRLFFSKAHVGSKRDKTENRYFEYDQTTIPMESSEKVEEFLNHLVYDPLAYPNVSSNIEEFLLTPPGKDIPMFNQIKTTALNIFDEWLGKLSQTNSYRFLKCQMLINEQLLHFLQLSLPSNQFAVFNCGITNMCYIMPIGFHNSGADAGKAFMAFGITDDISKVDSIFGKVHYKRLKQKNLYLVVTNWRRLNAERACFLKDSFFSVLSTSLATLTRLPGPSILGNDLCLQKIRWTLACRSIIALSCSQVVAEKAADYKNMIMHSFSEYSKVHELIVDKFSPPFKNCVEVWIVSLIKKLSINCAYYQSNQGIELKNPVYIGSRRMVESLGGKLNFPSFWSDTYLQSTQDLLDDLYLYVHTPKEPSNIHHENVKSIKTILKFQNQFDQLSQINKDGLFSNYENLKRFIMQDVSIGHDQSILYKSIQHTNKKTDTSRVPNAVRKILNENILEISSTKSCIPELVRTVDLYTSQKHLRKKKKQELLTEKNSSISSRLLKDDLRYKTGRGRLMVNQSTNRMKVHDAMVEYSYDNKLTTVSDLAFWNMQQNNSRVETDICIKAQYGAKREFYVVNLGAKCMMRIMEDSYKELCKGNSSEMISVPGDKKLLNIQDKINKVLLTKTKGKFIYSINGDCTKWSAAETLQAFDTMSQAMCGVFSKSHIAFLRRCCHAWANKNIYVPSSIIQNLHFVDKATEYIDLRSGTFKSTQNFLQGMMNYASSYKAVSCSNYTYYIWKKLNPSSKLELEHLEHSDDYLLLIKTHDQEELKRFRILHRIMMKFHGFNDSLKKTNTQRLLTEFISLISFNGQMTYPQIKKTKEVGMNTSCTGYKDDMDFAISRCAEAVRIGIDHTTSYIMLRIHQANILRSYSLMNGMHNNTLSYSQMLNIPTEIYGVPDILPLVSLNVKGNPNNFRLLYQHDEISIKCTKILRNLLKLQIDKMKSTNYIDDIDPLMSFSFYSPSYTYDTEGKLIKNIRENISLNFEEAKEFSEKHRSYSFMKPKTNLHKRTWLESQYYKKTFSIAYSRISRAQLTLRLSRLTKNKCIIPDCILFSGKHENNAVSILEFQKLFLEYNNSNDSILNENEQLIFHRLTISSDPTTELLYNMLSTSNLDYDGLSSKELTATLMPHKPKWFTISNPINSLFQYIFNYEDFIQDGREYIGITSLEKDKCALEKLYNVKLTKETDYMIMNSIFKDLLLNSEKRNICMIHSTAELRFENFITNMLEFQTVNGTKFKLTLRGSAEAQNPYTRELYYKKEYYFAKEEIRLCLDDSILLYGLLKHSLDYDITKIKMIFRHMNYVNKFTGEEFNLMSMLSNINYQSLVSFDPKNYELKELAFLKWALFNDTEVAYALLDTVSSYGYKYINLNNQDIDESVHISYGSISFLAVKLKLNNQVLILGDSLKKHEFLFVYIIALRLFNLISVGLFETQLGLIAMKNVPLFSYGDIHQSLKQIQLYPHMFYMTDKWNKYDFDKSSDENITPFIYCPDLDITAKLTSGKLPHSIQFDEASSTFFIGKLKYFTAPYFQAKQTGVLKYIGTENFNIHGLKIQWLLQNNRMQSLIHEDYGNLRNLEPSDLEINDIYMNNYLITGGYNFIKKVIEYDEEMSISEKTAVKSEPKVESSALELDMGDFDINTDFQLDFMDTIQDEDENESEIFSNHPESDTNSTPESTERDYINFKSISEFVQSTPYFIPETKTSFTIGSPRSIVKLRDIKNFASKAIYSSSKAFPYLASLKLLHKYIIMRTFIKLYEDFYTGTINNYLNDKLRLLLIAHCCSELSETLKHDDLEKISDEFMLVQTENTLVLILYDDENPDDEEYHMAKKSNQYYTINQILYKGSSKVTERLPMESYVADFIGTHMPENLIKQILGAQSSNTVFSFIRKSWIDQYNIQSKLKGTKKKRQAMEIMKQIDIANN